MRQYDICKLNTTSWAKRIRSQSQWRWSDKSTINGCRVHLANDCLRVQCTLDRTDTMDTYTSRDSKIRRVRSTPPTSRMRKDKKDIGALINSGYTDQIIRRKER